MVTNDGRYFVFQMVVSLCVYIYLLKFCNNFFQIIIILFVENHLLKKLQTLLSSTMYSCLSWEHFNIIVAPNYWSSVTTISVKYFTHHFLSGLTKDILSKIFLTKLERVSMCTLREK